MPCIELIGSVIFGIYSTQGLKFSFYFQKSSNVLKLSPELGRFVILFLLLTKLVL